MKKYHTKKIIRTLCCLLLALAAAFSVLSCGGENPPEDVPSSPAWASDFSLPDADKAMERLKEIYGGEENMFLLRAGGIVRMPCPQNETITFNMKYEVNDFVKLVLEDSVAEFNEIFSVINPNYRFAIDFAPKSEAFEKKYSVRMSSAETLSVSGTGEAFGVAQINYYNNFTEIGDFGITMKNEVLKNGSYLMTTFKHEAMHLLGAGDAYKNEAATKNTIMQSYTVGGCHFLSSTDVAFLDALYRNPSLETSDEEIQSFIDGYETDNAHSREKVTGAVYTALVDKLDKTAVLKEAQNIGYKDLTRFAEQVDSGIIRDKTFGSESIAFSELEYAEPQSETYFGSIDPENSRYWHGRQTTLGSSQGISYTDYGSGILYAAPNGNQYTIMIKTGDFVLAFRLGARFTELNDLSLSLWHISK